jgi:hypothetical protein
MAYTEEFKAGRHARAIAKPEAARELSSVANGSSRGAMFPDPAKTLIREKDMSEHDIHEHHEKAAHHHEQAAKHHREAAKHHKAGNHEKASHHARIAYGHRLHAAEHHDHAAKMHAEEHS